MTNFTLTREHLSAFLDPTSEGEWRPFFGAIDPDVRWVIGKEEKSPKNVTGVYNIATYLSEVAGPMTKCLDGKPLKMTVSTLEIVGNKAIIEAVGEATQANGRPYRNNFSPDTGKIVEIKEYMDTAHTQEVIEGNSNQSQTSHVVIMSLFTAYQGFFRPP
ncbi:hypothetical protein B0H19DRAFT_1079354 [Mycena capillaripes]|nr:hypothetical protein B0H19DRAFT_1079354 [Mycena capillaripes]